MNIVPTLGEYVAPYFNQALSYIGKRAVFEAAAKADPIGFASKWVAGLGGACLATRALSTAWSSKSTVKKLTLYTASLALYGLAAYELAAPLYGRVSVDRNFAPQFIPHKEL